MLIIDGEEFKEETETFLNDASVRRCRVQSNVIVKLDLSYNELETFVVDGNLPNLQHLDLSVNRLTSFSINGPSLQKLYLSANSLETFVVDENLSNLQELYLTDNQLTSFVIKRSLSNLRELSLSNNQLTSWSADENLPSLQVLYLSNNKLETFDARENLPNLRKFYISHNLDLSFLGLRVVNLELDVYLNDTNVRFVDPSVFPHVQGKKVKAREHALGTIDLVVSTFHAGNPIVDEIVDEIEI